MHRTGSGAAQLGGFVLALGAICAPAWAGPCDLTWNGDALAQNAKARPLAAGMHLTDSNKNQIAELTGAQIVAIAEAKDAIAKQLGRNPSFVFCSDRAPNAFAMDTPNGEVVGVTIGLAALLDGDRDMAAFVIGHEYAHLIRGHLAAARERRQALEFLGVLAGALLEYKTQAKTHIQGIGMDVGRLGAELISYKFDRDQEREADEYGFGYAVDAGFSPAGAPRVAELFLRHGEAGIGLFFDNHPGWSERAETFQALLSASPKAQALLAKTGPRTVLVASAAGTGGIQVALEPIYETTNAERTMADGLAAIERKDYQGGVTAIRSAAATGYAPAQNLLGYMYSEGRVGLQKDEAEGVRLYRLAAAQGDGMATNNLGAMYMTGRGGLERNPAEATRLYAAAAEKGVPLAYKNLGDIYLLGTGGAQIDQVAAANYYQKAIDAGNADAIAQLGFLYQNGMGGLQKDPEKAVEMYRDAAAKGSGSGRYRLATAYELGFGGVPVDLPEAVKLLQQAANQGITGAYNDLGAMYMKGAGGLAKNETQAVTYYKLAAERGFAISQANLGMMYLKGLGGLFKDSTEAARYFRLAADQGNPTGLYGMGLLYEFGEGGVHKDKSAAIELYKKAAAKDLAAARDRLIKLGAN